MEYEWRLEWEGNETKEQRMFALREYVRKKWSEIDSMKNMVSIKKRILS